MAEKIKGTVKWFSNRKGFGFITPSSESSPTTEDIFVHQSNIVTEADYRTLKDGFEVEFEAITDDNGKLKAQNVTAADGTACPGPEPRERRRRRVKKEGEESGDEENGGDNAGEPSDDGEEKKPKTRRRRNRNGKKSEDGKEAKPQPKSWYADLDESVQKSLETRNIKVDGGRAFLALGDARIKLGTGGYMALAHASAMLAEGTYTIDKDGKVDATWTHVLKYDGAEWNPSTADDEKDILMTEISLVDDSVTPTGEEETTETLWGEGKADPKEALEKNGLQMRKVALQATAGGGRRRGRNRGRRNNKKPSEDGGNDGNDGEQKAAETAE